MRLLILVPAALIASSAFSASFKEPYALVESGDASEVRKEARVAITKVDGESVRSTRQADPIAPGSHRLMVHFTSARGQFRPEYRELAVDLEPCTRYRVVAVYQSKTGGDWTPRVYSEPIGECRRKFNMQ